jgi:gas vesicle protein
MTDSKQGNDDARILAPVVGFALGALVGTGLALLFAPASGERTRRRLGNAARRLSRDARHGFDEARETVGEVASGLGADVKAAIDAGREAIRRDGESLEPRPTSRIAQTPNPSPTRMP